MLKLCFFSGFCMLVFLSSCSHHTLLHLQDIEPVIFLQDGNVIFQYWEVDNHPSLWSDQTGKTPALDLYKDSLSMVLGDSVMNWAVGRERFQKNLTDKTITDSLNNYELVHQGYLGKIRNINLLEAQLLNYQLARYPLLSHPTEFHGFVLLNSDSSKIRAYFGASDQPFPPGAGPIVEQMEKALTSGWKLAFHLHNHYEPDSNYYVGIMSASMADAHFYKSMHEAYVLPNAMITNGFNTVVLQPEEYYQLNSH